MYNACALFCFNIVYYMNVYKNLLLAVIDKTEIIIYESNIFLRFFQENFPGNNFSEKLLCHTDYFRSLCSGDCIHSRHFLDPSVVETIHSRN